MKVIEVVPYDPNWPHIFEAEAVLIKEALGDNCIEVHHIGSTSVPGLAAKPIIDIIPVVRDITLIDKHQSKMEVIGYEAMGEYGIPLRRYFQKGIPIRTHNVHIYEQGSSEIQRHIKFRDWLRAYPDVLAAYGTLKKDLANRFPDDILSYCLGKEEFITNIDKQAGWHGFRFAKALTPREWESTKYFRDKYFFSPHGIDDPYTWTFNHPDHAHLVLYGGTEIIGYAHIQFWPEDRAAIRIIVVEEANRNKNAGSTFLALCEKWLRSLSIRSVHAESRQDSLRFYLKNGYTEMLFNEPQEHESDPNDIPVGKILLPLSPS